MKEEFGITSGLEQYSATLQIAGVRNFYMEGSEVAEIRVWCRGVLPP